MPTPSDVGRRPGRHPRTRGRVFPDILRHDSKIKGNTARGHLDQFRRCATANDNLIAGRALEQGGDLVQRAGYATTRYRLGL